ncbi:uncharacterized protein Dsimw501_GD27621, isoform C [Drosophila simulans]|uniref:Uncharacterized protein, isoform C n=1 Tax=Drosophila simulans TaxID=7240 RepID=A0A0J9RYJ6_DROSI|nr:uncharacterized protein LOC27207736 isoform X3 [Drosophila simulans]KMZ00658.1 uncharacterized protein Dsimw501_GD27621, isoform C [Drosophila simulans]
MGCILIALAGIFLAGMNIDYILLCLNRTYFREMQDQFPEQGLYTVIQIVPDFLNILASVMLIFAIISQYGWLFWTTLFFQAFQAVYFLIFSFTSASLGSNLIINESIWHNLAMKMYFMYIVYSYYRQLKPRATENMVEGLE